MTPSDAVEVLVGNPFDVRPERFAAAVAVLSRASTAATVIRDTAERSVAAAERALLAVAHAAASTAPSSLARILGPDVLPAALLRKLAHARGEYLAVGGAAGRCVRALGSVRGNSAAMAEVRRATWAACFGDSLVHALVLAPVIRDHDVLVLGETGTGKEGVARALQEGALGGHDGGPAPRAALNIAAVPETLVAAELFGHVKGAFTGANEPRIGQIRTAHGGSLFLDEIGDLVPSTQVKLLRVMETNEVTPLGSDKSYRASCRYIAATHRDLDAMVTAGHFRRDLHQRLAGMVIRLPALRDRPDDILAIGEAFVDRYLPKGTLSSTRSRIGAWLASNEARRHSWPGNVRELENAIRSMLLGLPPDLDAPRSFEAASSHAHGKGDLPRAIRDATATLDELVKWYVRRVVDRRNGNLARAAQSLNVDRNTVRRRLERGSKSESGMGRG